MSTFIALANFVFLLWIVVFQCFYNNQLRIEFRKELQDVALVGLQTHYRHMSNYARFTAMASDGKLILPAFSEDPLEWGSWLQQQVQRTQACTLRVKNDDGKYETISHLSMYIMGYRWDPSTEMWPANKSDISQLTATAIIKYTPSATDEEKGFLKADEELHHFHNARLHRQMQVTLRSAVVEALRGHALFTEIDLFDKTIGPLDLYQGSRLLAKLVDICHSHLCRAKGKFLTKSNGTSRRNS